MDCVIAAFPSTMVRFFLYILHAEDFKVSQVDTFFAFSLIATDIKTSSLRWLLCKRFEWTQAAALFSIVCKIVS